MNTLSLQVKLKLSSSILKYITEQNDICTFSTDAVLYNNASHNNVKNQPHSNEQNRV